MSLERGIRCFLDDVDPIILARGENYYRSERVESIGHVSAKISGSKEEAYLITCGFFEAGDAEDPSQISIQQTTNRAKLIFRS